ncbi:MAG: hypothetical protein IKZ13_00950 [Akkermansia sp.]|nr:hypothetical protein [Akkermansia sp.]
MSPSSHPISKQRVPFQTAMPPTPKPRSGGGGFWVVLLLLLAMGGGGWYMYDQSVKEEARLAAEARARAEAEKQRKAAEAARKAEEEARRKAAAEEEARRKAEEEEARRKAEEEEEARRKAEEEARRQAEEAGDDTPEPKKEEESEETPSEEEVQPGPYDAPLPMTGGGVTARETKELYDSMIDRLVTEGDFAEFHRAFNSKIKAAIPEIINNDKLNYNSYKRSKPLMQSVELCRLTHLAGATTLTNIVKPDKRQQMGEAELGTESGRNFMLWMLRDKNDPLGTFMQAFTANQGNPANMAYHLKTFFKLWELTPEKERARYLNLAIACALVAPSRATAAPQTKTKQPALSIEQVYAYFREQDARNKLLTDITKMDVTNLLFVVDVRLPRSEFDWVMKNLKYSQAQWGDAYASIRYRMEIAAGSLSEAELYQRYTFDEIREDGGVCRHQAYFASNTAKCKGIPAVYIVGDGDRGPHAWIASMIDTTSWKQTGSYGYNTGRFSNPCSGRSMHESVLLNRTKKTGDDKLAAAYTGMMLAEHLVSMGCTTEARSASRYVTGSFPLLTAAWDSRISVLTADEDNIPEADYWRKMSNELARLGKKNAELLDRAADIDNNYALEGKSDSAKKNTMKKNLDKLKRTVGNERSDLLLEAVDRQAALLSEAGDVRGLGLLYNKTLKENTRRGDVFGSLLRQYVGHMEKAGATKRDWTSMAKATEKIFEKNVLTNTTDHFKLSKEVEIQKIISTIYAKAENTKKADKLKEAAEERLRLSSERNG